MIWAFGVGELRLVLEEPFVFEFAGSALERLQVLQLAFAEAETAVAHAIGAEPGKQRRKKEGRRHTGPVTH